VTTQWFNEVLVKRSYRGVRRGMTADEVGSLLGEPERRQPEKKGRGGILAYAGVQVFTKEGVVDHLTIRVDQLDEALSRSQALGAAERAGLELQRSELMSDEHTDYFACDGVHLLVQEEVVSFVTLCDPGMVV